MIHRLITLAFGALALLFCAGCSDYSVARQELHARYLAEEDALLVLEVEYGIDAGDVPDPKAVEALLHSLNGARRYPPEGGLVSFDFDKPLPEAAQGMEREQRDLKEFAANVKVEDTHMFVDERKRLSFLRLTRISHVQRMLKLLNAFMNRASAREASWAKPLASEFPIFDQGTYDAFHKAVADGHEWLRIENEAFVIDAPMTEANAARCLQWIRQGSKGEREAEYYAWFDQMTSCEVGPEHTQLRFCEPPQRRFEIGFDSNGDRTDFSALATELTNRAVPIGAATLLEKKFALLDAQPAARTPK
ncbi:MAG: hypothetical protein IPJ19_16115 [Planctomycetes bacterium]|nr:hypothetical protein [Planctomycetota bacterium]